MQPIPDSLSFLLHAHHLPLTTVHWHGYFEQVHQLLSRVLPLVTYGHHKFSFIVTQFELFRSGFGALHRVTLTRLEVNSLFQFFKACGGLISLVAVYSPRSAIGHFLSHPSDQQFTELSFLWRGWALAVVRLATLLPSGDDVAVKELKAVQLSPRNLQNLKCELHALLSLDHPNLLGCIGVTVTRPFSILSRFLSGGSLYTAICEGRSKRGGLRTSEEAALNP